MIRNLKTGAARAGQTIIDAVLPPRCVLTGAIVGAPGALTPEAFRALSFITDPFCAACGVPFAYDMGPLARCVECAGEGPPFETARAAVKYDDASRPLILGFKHGDKTHAVTAFAPWLRRAGADMLAEADIIMPVPLHRWRLIARRYNQAAIIASSLGRETGMETVLDGLIRLRPTPTQGRLKAAERAKNVRGAFAVNPACDVRGKSIVIVDDVYTTGATVKECAKVLKKEGAAAVHVLTLARVTKGDFA